MTLRPHIIRADTLDLQDHETPSAGDHTHQPEHPGPLGSGPPAPHQEDALRHLSQDRSAEQDHLADVWGSGRSSHEGSDLLDDDMSNSNGETRLDEAAIQQNGGTSDNPDGDGEDNMDEDMVDDRSSSPSILEDEIDPDFVYALHNFVATVEGQANATKGDHMVLLDDTNSYWWLVRVVKDSSIGYLPAEHIETPNERLARLHKHRNIQVNTQNALEDFQQKSKNPLKKAMRRRNAKTVQFGSPTYYEPEDIDWSDVEGDSDHEDEPLVAEIVERQQDQQNDSEEPADADMAHYNGQIAHPIEDADDSDIIKPLASENMRTAIDSSRPEQESLEERTLGRSRNGTMRNTDSFFKDDTAEPRKISLTPNILREESGDSSARSSRSTDKALTQDVFEQMDNSNFATAQAKEDKKKKDKKSGMLSGLFKRKDKKIKVDEAAGGSVVKHDVDSSSPTLTPGDSGPTSPTGSSSPSMSSSKRPLSGGKTSKSPPTGLKSNGAVVAPADGLQATQSTTAEGVTSAEIEETSENSNILAGDQSSPSRQLTLDTSMSQPTESKSRSFFSSQSSDPKPEKLKKAKQRVDLDVESSPEEPLASDDPISGVSRDGDFDFSNHQDVPVSPIGQAAESSWPRFNLAVDTSTKAPQSITPPTPLDTTELVQDATETQQPPSINFSSRSIATAEESVSSESSSPASATTPPATESTDQPWNDAALRSYLDGRSNDDVKDMIIRVHDTAGVAPLPLNHPKMLGLGYYESQKQLDDMTSQLDGLLNGFLARSAARPKTQRK